jgi:hypothetical protein
VVDTENARVVEMATVRLLSPNDSSLIQGAQSDINGHFVLNNVKSGKYILRISSVGYHDNIQDISVERQDVLLKNIDLKENAQLLSEVEVKGTAAQMLVKGDTIEYNATAFKTTENAVVEELLKRLPGVEIDSEGKITVNGEEIKKIRVDGEKFFDGDMEMATKNIPADLIEKVQVLEKKSEMAQLTGFEDDGTERIINLTIKPNRKKGTFGNLTGGLGMDIDNQIRYDGNGFINLMRGNSQTAFTGGANNVNTTRSSRGRGSWGAGNGITQTRNIGVNNNTIFNDRFKFGGDGSFNHSSNHTSSNTNKESYLQGSVYNDTTKNSSNNNHYSVNGRVELEWNIDSLNTLILQPNVNHSRSFSDSKRDFVYARDEVETSRGLTENNGNSFSTGAGINIIYNRKSADKKGRSLTVNFRSDFSSGKNESYNYSKVTTDKDSIVDQFTDNKSNRYNLDLRMSHVEPLWNAKNMLETVIGFRNTRNTSDKNQYNNRSGVYDDFDETYSNDFSNLFFSETVEFNYRFTEKDYNLTLGIKGEPSQTYSRTVYGDGTTDAIENNVFNFAPRARFQYNFGPKKFARIDYRGNSRQPGVNQMQPGKNNSNLMHETVGNPALNPAFDHRFILMYTAFDEQTFSSLSVSLNGGFTKDALVTSSLYDSTGKQYSRTVNAEKNPYNLSGQIMYNIPLFERKFHFNTATTLAHSTRYGYSGRLKAGEEVDLENFDGDLSKTTNFNAGEQLSLTYTHEVIELGARATLRYSNTTNKLSDRKSETWDRTATGNVILRLPKNLHIATDIHFRTRTGYSNFDQNELIWNASLEKSLFKNSAVVSFKAYDLLRRQLNIRQSIGDNYIQYSSYNALRSYFLVSFTYKINKFSGGASESDMRRTWQRGPRGVGGWRP